MKLSIDICKDRAAWDTFVKSTLHPQVFHTTSFLSALDVDYELVTVSNDEEVLAGCAVLLQDGKALLEPVPYHQYCSILLAASLQSRSCHRRVKIGLDIVLRLIEYVITRYGAVRYQLDPVFGDLRSLQWFNYHSPELGTFSVQLRYSGLIEVPELARFDDYVAAIRSVRRQEYKRALREGLVVEDCDDVDLLDNLHDCTFARQGVKRPDREIRLLRSISQAALESHFGVIKVAKTESGQVVGATLFLHDALSGYYFVGANDPAYRKTGASTLLFMENVRECAERKLSTIDVVGLNSPQRGDYKSSFNAEPVSYFVAVFNRTSGNI